MILCGLRTLVLVGLAAASLANPPTYQDDPASPSARLKRDEESFEQEDPFFHDFQFDYYNANFNGGHDDDHDHEYDDGDDDDIIELHDYYTIDFDDYDGDDSGEIEEYDDESNIATIGEALIPKTLTSLLGDPSAVSGGFLGLSTPSTAYASPTETYPAPPLYQESPEEPGLEDDTYEFSYAVASEKHGDFHGHQQTRDINGNIHGSYYLLSPDGHWRQTIFSDVGGGFNAITIPTPGGSPPSQVSAVSFQVFVPPGASRFHSHQLSLSEHFQSGSHLGSAVDQPNPAALPLSSVGVSGALPQGSSVAQPNPVAPPVYSAGVTAAPFVSAGGVATEFSAHSVNDEPFGSTVSHTDPSFGQPFHPTTTSPFHSSGPGGGSDFNQASTSFPQSGTAQISGLFPTPGPSQTFDPSLLTSSNQFSTLPSLPDSPSHHPNSISHSSPSPHPSSIHFPVESPHPELPQILAPSPQPGPSLPLTPSTHPGSAQLPNLSRPRAIVVGRPPIPTDSSRILTNSQKLSHAQFPVYASPHPELLQELAPSPHLGSGNIQIISNPGSPSPRNHIDFTVTSHLPNPGAIYFRVPSSSRNELPQVSTASPPITSYNVPPAASKSGFTPIPGPTTLIDSPQIPSHVSRPGLAHVSVSTPLPGLHHVSTPSPRPVLAQVSVSTPLPELHHVSTPSPRPVLAQVSVSTPRPELHHVSTPSPRPVLAQVSVSTPRPELYHASTPSPRPGPTRRPTILFRPGSTPASRPLPTQPPGPLITTPSGPLITTPSGPLITTPSGPLITTPSGPLITTPSGPLITTPSGPLITTPSPLSTLISGPFPTPPSRPVSIPPSGPLSTLISSPLPTPPPGALLTPTSGPFSIPPGPLSTLTTGSPTGPGLIRISSQPGPARFLVASPHTALPRVLAHSFRPVPKNVLATPTIPSSSKSSASSSLAALSQGSIPSPRPVPKIIRISSNPGSGLTSAHPSQLGHSPFSPLPQTVSSDGSGRRIVTVTLPSPSRTVSTGLTREISKTGRNSIFLSRPRQHVPPNTPKQRISIIRKGDSGGSSSSGTRRFVQLPLKSPPPGRPFFTPAHILSTHKFRVPLKSKENLSKPSDSKVKLVREPGTSRNNVLVRQVPSV